MVTTYNQGMSPLKLVALMILAASFFILTAMAVNEYNHANAVHGVAEAQSVRDCLNKYGPTMTYREPNGVIHRLCLDPDTGKWGDLITKIINGVETEVTSFIPKAGVLARILEWFERKGATKWKSAPPFNR